MDQQSIDAMTRAARAWLAAYDANKNGEHGMRDPLPCMCSHCEGTFTRDMMLQNEGAGYLCPTCGDKELSALRRKLRKMEHQRAAERGQAGKE